MPVHFLPSTLQTLAQHLSGTVVSDLDQMPLVVFRGEHGESTELIHSRTRAISFGTACAASEYAQHPNRRGDTAFAPRVTPVYLTIRNPALDNRDDPFIEMGDIVEKLGRHRAELIARRFADHVENTGNWVEGFAHDFESVEHLLDMEPDRLADLYLDAYPVFDDDEVVGWFAEAGYDGAIHMGNGITALEPEYKVFDKSQVHCAIGVDQGALQAAMLDMGARANLVARCDAPKAPRGFIMPSDRAYAMPAERGTQDDEEVEEIEMAPAF